MLEESKWLRRAQRGDPDAFEQLLAPYERRVYALSLRMMGNAEDARDAAQDAMVRIWRALPDYQESASLSTWIYKVTSSACLDALRKRKVRAQESLDAMVEDGFAPTSGINEPEEALMRDARERRVREGLQSLPEDLRAAIVLRDIQGERYEDVAQALGVNVGTVKSRIHRAREKLCTFLLQSPELFTPARVQRIEGQNGRSGRKGGAKN